MIEMRMKRLSLTSNSSKYVYIKMLYVLNNL